MDSLAANISRVLTGLDSMTLVGGMVFALLVYMLPTILAAMGINPTSPTDGRSHTIGN